MLRQSWEQSSRDKVTGSGSSAPSVSQIQSLMGSGVARGGQSVLEGASWHARAPSIPGGGSNLESYKHFQSHQNLHLSRFYSYWVFSCLI